MPLFRSKKDKMLKDKSKSSLDLFSNFELKNGETKKELKRKSGSTFNLFTPPNLPMSPNQPMSLNSPKSHTPPDVVAILTKAHKNKSKSTFHLYQAQKNKSKSTLSLFDSNNNISHNNNNNNNLSYFKERVRSSTAVVPFRKISASSMKLDEDSRCGRSDETFINSNGSSSPPRNRPMRKHSQSSTDSVDNGRERRLSDIAQLDNYIEYLRRSEDCSMSNVYNRLCCAQVLRLVLLRQQQMHDNEALHSARSHERLDNHHSPHGGSPEISHKPLPFTRKGSTRKFKRPAPGILSGKLPLERIDSGALAETSSVAGQQFEEASSGSEESLFKGRWNSTSSISLMSNSSENGLSSDSAHDSDDVFTNHGQAACGKQLSVALPPSEIEIY